VPAGYEHRRFHEGHKELFKKVVEVLDIFMGCGLGNIWAKVKR
jgi:hypothetical protein